MIRRSGFTLIEILAVAGVAAVLAAILVPAIGAVRNASNQTVCLCHIRQLGAATLSYVADNQQLLPDANFAAKDAPGNRGWLYTAPLAASNVDTQLETGVVYPYLHTHTVYRCPEDDAKLPTGPAQTLSSFTMNGAVVGYASIAQYGAYRFTRMPPSAVAFWECGQGPGAFIGGGSTPDVGVANRHGNCAAVTFFDGHSERWTAERFAAEQANQPGALWCNPKNSSGM